ncbi:hypothetical protein [Microbacterium sp. P04]|uniref:hypothetical protein n=1 Tax=Microbacterium sp. P04 TaxID=3366947 RepID=UPI003744C2AF
MLSMSSRNPCTETPLRRSLRALIAVSAAAEPPMLGLAAIGGMLTYFAAGAVTDGIRHTVEAAAALLLYGATDLRLLLAHSILPALMISASLAVGVAITVMFSATTIWPVLAALLLTAAGSVVLRI